MEGLVFIVHLAGTNTRLLFLTVLRGGPGLAQLEGLKGTQLVKVVWVLRGGGGGGGGGGVGARGRGPGQSVYSEDVLSLLVRFQGIVTAAPGIHLCSDAVVMPALTHSPPLPSSQGPVEPSLSFSLLLSPSLSFSLSLSPPPTSQLLTQ